MATPGHPAGLTGTSRNSSCRWSGSLPGRTGACRPGSWLGRAVPRIRGPSDRGGATACTGGYSSEACVYRPPLACRYTATPTRLSERQISRRRFQACTRTSAAQRSSCVHTLLDARGYIQATKRPCEWAGPDQALRVITRSPSHQGRVAPLHPPSTALLRAG